MPTQGAQLGEASAAHTMEGFVAIQLGMLLELAAVREHAVATFHSAGMRLFRRSLDVDDIFLGFSFETRDMVVQTTSERVRNPTFAAEGLVTGQSGVFCE